MGKEDSYGWVHKYTERQVCVRTVDSGAETTRPAQIAWLGLKSSLQHEGNRCLSASQPAAALFLLG